ncbi:Cupin 1 [Dillenia turbinata]|uniref:Cupin 1 n=1 Tax=Dillenia turbinata TaxID=194707 RepID=A0AAN8Z8V1_9MAGN
MSPTLTLLFVLLYYIHIVSASDPDPLQDFCIPNNHPTTALKPCMNSSLVVVNDFIFSGIKYPGDFHKTGFSSQPVNVNNFPGLNTLGMSFVRADFDKGGINVPHLHPRATETAFVLEGKIYSGFVDTQNRVFAKVIEKGEVMVFSRGLVHFQMNVGDSPATILGMFNSQNPGLVKIPNAIFGSEIRDELLEKAFGMSSKEVDEMKRRFSPHNRARSKGNEDTLLQIPQPPAVPYSESQLAIAHLLGELAIGYGCSKKAMNRKINVTVMGRGVNCTCNENSCQVYGEYPMCLKKSSRKTEQGSNWSCPNNYGLLALTMVEADCDRRKNWRSQNHSKQTMILKSTLLRSYGSQ